MSASWIAEPAVRLLSINQSLIAGLTFVPKAHEEEDSAGTQDMQVIPHGHLMWIFSLAIIASSVSTCDSTCAFDHYRHQVLHSEIHQGFLELYSKS